MNTEDFCKRAIFPQFRQSFNGSELRRGIFWSYREKLFKDNSVIRLGRGQVFYFYSKLAAGQRKNMQQAKNFRLR